MSDSSHQLRLCIIITRLIAGGAQRVVLDLIEHLDPYYDIHLISGAETGSEGSLWDEARVLLPPEKIHVCSEMIRNISPHRDYRAYKQLCRLLTKIKPDIVHTHTSKAGFIGRLAAHTLRVPRVIHSTHGLIYDQEAMIPGVSGKKVLLKLFKQAEKHAGNKADALICLSEKEVGDALRLGLGKNGETHCIPNGVYLGPFRDILRSPEDWKKKKWRIGTAGRLNSEKGHELLIRSFAQLGKQRKDLSLSIAGEGPLLGELIQLTQTLGIQDQVEFPGYVDIAQFMRDLDLFVLPSHYEGFGLVLVEAMAAGLPVVATDVGGVSEVLDQGRAGIIVPPGSEPDLRMGIEYLLDNIEQCWTYSQKGKIRADAKYSLRHMLQAHREVYEPEKPAKNSITDDAHLVDLHIHSKRSPGGSLTAEAILEVAKSKKLKAIAVTDHGSMEETSRLIDLAESYEIMIIPAMEFETEIGDVIGYFLKEEIQSTDFKTVVEEVRSQEGLLCLPHPFKERRSISLDVVQQVDIIEIVNGRLVAKSSDSGIFGDRDIVTFAHEYHKSGIGGSDALKGDAIGCVQTALPPFHSLNELKKILKEGQIYPVQRHGEWVESTLV